MEGFDFYITTNGRLIIPKYNLNFLVSISESSLPSMPEASESSVRIAGRDGDISLMTVYEPMNFTIVCYTDDNLSPLEKRQAELKLNNFLNEMKINTKTFAFQRDEKFFNVKYNGVLTTTNFPMHLKFSIPLKSSNSFAYDITEKKITGNGTLESQTVDDVGAEIIIKGPATAPIISLNDYSMEYDRAILTGNKLIIDTRRSTCTLVTSTGETSNAMRYYNHQFPRIQNGTNELKVLSGIDNANNVTVTWHDYKL